MISDGTTAISKLHFAEIGVMHFQHRKIHFKITNDDSTENKCKAVSIPIPTRIPVVADCIGPIQLATKSLSSTNFPCCVGGYFVTGPLRTIVYKGLNQPTKRQTKKVVGTYKQKVASIL